MLEQMFQMSPAVKRPMAMFVDQSDSASIRAAVDAGVSAYIVDGLKKERITSILDLCISRFNAFARLQGELDRAKGVLMKAKKLSEEEAYALMRKTAGTAPLPPSIGRRVTLPAWAGEPLPQTNARHAGEARCRHLRPRL